VVSGTEEVLLHFVLRPLDLRRILVLVVRVWFSLSEPPKRALGRYDL
jgi:hypothetical protein